MTNDAITERLAQMLSGQGQTDGDLMDAEDRAAEGLVPRQPGRVERLDAAIAATESTGGLSPSREQAAADPSFYFGRGPTGRLRNFRAMNDVKLRQTYEQLRYENNDAEAMAACQAEGIARELWAR